MGKNPKLFTRLFLCIVFSFSLLSHGKTMKKVDTNKYNMPSIAKVVSILYKNYNSKIERGTNMWNYGKNCEFGTVRCFLEGVSLRHAEAGMNQCDLALYRKNIKKTKSCNKSGSIDDLHSKDYNSVGSSCDLIEVESFIAEKYGFESSSDMSKELKILNNKPAWLCFVSWGEANGEWLWNRYLYMLLRVNSHKYIKGSLLMHDFAIGGKPAR